MADMVSLREYLDELDMLLENESPTEVVSHCRYILQYFPHNVETYRLLGKALLQKGHHESNQEYFEEAAEVFLRVLSVLPNDHITHLGLSEIREVEGDLDRAIWHLERAYEQLPGNTVLQEALLDLYTRRDGEHRVPDKIQMTRSGLARQFANSNLYEQALIELRAAVAQDPQRTDLHVLLAELLWESGHPVEAGEAAVEVLKKLPNSLAANRIMAGLWLEYERPSDAQRFLDRLEAIDPYEAAHLIQPEEEVLDPNRLPRLDYNAQATAELSSETPAWVHDLDDFGESAAMEDLFLAPAGPAVEEPELPQGSGGIDMDAIFRAPYETDQGDDWGDEAAETDVPDWFGGMSLGAANEPERPATPEEWPAEEPGPALDEEEEADAVPDWFAEMTGIQPEEQSPVESDWPFQPDVAADAGQEYPSAAEDDLGAMAAGWLLETDEAGAPGEEDMFPQPDVSGAAMPDWFPASEEADPEKTVPAPEDTGGAESAQDALVPDWLLDDDETEPEIAGMAFGDESPPDSSRQDTVSDDWLASLDAASEALPETGEFAPGWMPQEPQSGDFNELFPADPERASAEAQPDSEGDWLSALSEASDENLFTLGAEQEAAESWMMADDLTPEDAVTDEDVSRGFSGYLAEIVEPRDAEDSVETPGVVHPAEEEWPALDDEAAEPAPEDELFEAGEAVSDEDQGVEDGAGALEQQPRAADASPTESEEELDWWSAIGDEAAEDTVSADSAPPDEDAAVDLDALRRASMPPSDLDLDELMGQGEGTEEPAASTETSPEWMTEPEYDFFAPVQQADVSDADQQEEDWLGTLGDVGSVEATSEEREAQSEGLAWHEAETASADDDWLGSFAVERSEADLETGTEQAPGLEQAAEAKGWEADQPDDVEASVPVADDTDIWAAEVGDARDLQVDEAPEEVELSDEVGWSSAEDETLPTGAMDDEALLTASLETADPAWLADVEPIETPNEDQARDVTTGAPDAFSLDMEDESAEYGSAGDTGVLQPDELPDWMMAFTGEDMPDDELSGEPEADIWGALSEAAAHEQPEEAGPVAESLADLPFEDAEYAVPDAADTGTASDDLSLPDMETRADEGVMPEWLVAITSSEADKPEDLMFDDEEQYSQMAEETGVLQPSTTPDWLVGIGETQETGSELREAETAFDEFAQPDDLADTNIDEPGSEMAEFESQARFAETEFDEAVPADFSFDDQPPAWLRRPKESDLASPEPAPQDRASEMPEWLRDVMEEDDENID